MARLLSKEALSSKQNEFKRIKNVYSKDALMFTGISADTDLVSAGYTWVSMYFFDTKKSVRENIDTLSCIELDSGDTIHTLVDMARDEGFLATDEKPLNIVCYKSKIPLRYRKYSRHNNSSVNVDELF